MIVVGHRSRRVARFVAACAAEGVAVHLISHDAMLDGASLPDCTVRIESLGQDDAFAHRLLRLGLPDARDHGACRVIDAVELERDPPRGIELRAPRQLHHGIERYFARYPIERRYFTPPRDILTLFDKTATADALRRIGVPVPDEIPLADRCFVKLRYGSSSIGLAYVTPSAIFSTVARRGGRFFNSRRIQRYDRRDRAVLDFLIAEGARIEPAIPKARIGGRFVDLRVLVIAGEPAFVIARSSAHPITSLHLGSRRCDAAILRERVPRVAWDAMLDDCRRAADLLGAFHLGIDVIVRDDRRSHVVLEANAFGDLLNGVEVAGRDPYRHQAWLLAQLKRFDRADRPRPSCAYEAASSRLRSAPRASDAR